MYCTASESYRAILDQLKKVKITGDTAKACCPAHADKNPSLQVKLDGDRVLLHCFTGCTTDAILDALGWKMRDLFATDDTWRSHEARDIGDERTRRHGRRRPSLRTRLAACGSGLTR